jgi:hypothetical protein
MKLTNIIFGLSIIAILFITSTIVKAQNQTATIGYSNKNSIVRYINNAGNYDYTYNGMYGYYIGRADGTNGIRTASTEDVYRCQVGFYLGVLPTNAKVVNATLNISFLNYTDGTRKASVAALSSIRSYGLGWADVGAGSTYFNDVPYGLTPVLSSVNFTNAVKNAGSGYFYIGIKAVNEITNGTYATINIVSLTVEYTPPVSVTVQNSFGGGTVKVDGTQHNSPTSFSWVSGSSHTLEASNQSPNTFTQWYNVTTGSPIDGNPITICPTTSMTYQANFNSLYTVKVQNSFDGGVITVDNVQYNSPATFTWPAGISHSLFATNQDYTEPSNGVGYFRVFNDWTIPAGTQITNNPLSILPSGANATLTYTANFLKLFNVVVTNAQFIEPGSGGSYEVNDVNVGQNWQSTFKEGTPIPIKLNAIPPPSYMFVGWSDGETANPRNLSPADHVEDLRAIYKLPMKSTSTTATASNNSRKIARNSSGALFSVYESAGSIFFIESTDNGAAWLPEKLISGLPDANKLRTA